MSESITENKWLLMSVSLVIGWLSWISLQVMDINQQVSSISISQRDVIPPATENSLRQIRDESRSDRELLYSLSKIVEGNRIEIGFLKDKSKP